MWFVEAVSEAHSFRAYAGGTSNTDTPRHTSVAVSDLNDHDAFDAIARASACPYARRVTIVGVEAASAHDLPHASRTLRKFATDTQLHSTSIFGIGVSDALVQGDLASLARVLHSVIRLACTADEYATLKEGIDDPGWRLRVWQTDFFVVALSSVYPRTHRRHAANASALMFQPESLFSHLGVTSGPNRELVSDIVADQFARAGKPYTSAHTLGTPKARRFILDPSNEGIEWWDTSRL